MRQEQFNEIVKWQKETFPDANAVSKIIHCEDEIYELRIDVVNKNPDRRLEYADCLLLLFGAAHADGFSYGDICNAIDEKLKINKSRKWGTPDKNGVVNHIKD